MDLTETFAFVSVVRAGSFAAAARRLGVPKSTLSRQVTRLEDRLGTRLLQRTTRKLSLTQTGDAYYQRCLGAIEAIEDARRAVEDVEGAPRGLLRVSVPFDFCRDMLPPLLPELRRRFPELELSLDATQRRVDLVEEGFDVAIRGGDLPDAGFIARYLGKGDLILCASPTYLERCGRPSRVAELASHEAIGVRFKEGRLRMEGPEGLVELPLRPWLTCNEWGALLSAMIDGLGIGPMLEPTAAPHLASGSLERVLPDYALRGGGIYAIYPSRHHLSPKVRAFVDFLAEKLPERLGT